MARQRELGTDVMRMVTAVDWDKGATSSPVIASDGSERLRVAGEGWNVEVIRGVCRDLTLGRMTVGVVATDSSWPSTDSGSHDPVEGRKDG